jgi:hypothetical protein
MKTFRMKGAEFAKIKILGNLLKIPYGIPFE